MSSSRGHSPASNGPLSYQQKPFGPNSMFSPSRDDSRLGGGGAGCNNNPKREMRLIKNREAARECRRKKKEYIKCLENRVAVLENQNKALIEELKSLKEMYFGKSQAISK